MKRRADKDEIPSDSESEYEKENESENDDEEQYETAHQTNVRHKKEMIKKLKDEVKKRKLENVDEEVAKTLEEEALEKQGKLMKNLAEKCLKPETSIISFYKSKLELTCLVFSLDGRFVFTGNKLGDVVKWDAASATNLAIVKGGKKSSKHKFHCCRVTSIAICDEFLATGDNDNKIFIWNISDLTLKKVLLKHRKPITSLVYRKNTQQLFSADKKGIIFIWDMTLMSSIEELLGHTGEITAIDSNMLNNCVSCSGIGDLTVKLWKNNTTVVTYTLPKKHFELSLECITMINERYFVAGSLSNYIYLWDSTTKKTPIHVVHPAHGMPADKELIVGSEVYVISICALKQSNVFASGSNMSEVKIWNLVGTEGQYTVEVLFVLPGIRGYVNDLKFSPNGKDLAVGLCDEHKLNRMQKRTPRTKSYVNIYKVFG